MSEGELVALDLGQCFRENTILVSNIPSNVTQETLLIYFQSTKSSGGGEVAGRGFRRLNDNQALVTFADKQSQQQVLSREHNLSATSLKVEAISTCDDERFNQIGSEVHHQGNGNPCDEVPYSASVNPTNSVRVAIQQDVHSADSVISPIPEVADAKRNNVSSKVEGITNEVTSLQDLTEHEKLVEPKRLEVTGFREGITQETIELFFENKKRSGGGNIKEIQFDAEKNRAVIEFESSKDLDSVLGKPELCLGEKKLQVKLNAPKSKTAVCVTGMKQNTPLETLELYFEHPGKSNGGAIQNKWMNEDNTIAMIDFGSVEVAERVAAQKVHVLLGAALTVVQCSPGDVNEAGQIQSTGDKDSCYGEGAPQATVTKPLTALSATNFDPQTKYEASGLIFESAKRSDGSDIEGVHITEDKTEPVFDREPAEDTERAYQQNFQRKLADSPIVAELVQPPIPENEVPMDPYKVAVSNIPESASHELFLNYMENRTRCVVHEIQYGDKPGSSIVIFKQAPDMTKLHQACNQRQLVQSTLHVEPVYMTHSIQVHDLPANCTEDALENYFENTKKSGGGDVESVVIHQNGKVAVTTFADYRVANRVIEKKHEVNKCNIKVSEYYEVLGFRHPDDDLSKPVSIIPENVVVGPFDEAIVNFIRCHLDRRQLLDNALKKHHGQVNWEASTKDSLVVTCLLSGPEQLAEMPKPWKDRVAIAVGNFVADYSSESVSVLQDIWTDLLQKLSTHADENVTMETSDVHNTILLTGVKSAVGEVADKVSKLKKELEDEFNRKSQEVTEVTTLKEFELRLLRESGFVALGCNSQIDLFENQIQFTGIPLDVNKAKSDMYEILRKVIHEKVPSTSAKSLLLKNPECGEFIYSQFHSANIAASWTTTDTEITVFALDKNAATEAGQIMSRELSEDVISVQPESKPLFTGPQWHDIKQGQLTQHQGRLEIIEDSDLTKLTIAGTGSMTDSVHKVIQDFLDMNTIHERSVEMEINHFCFMNLYNIETVAQIQESLKKHRVEIRPVPTSSSFVIRGTIFGLDLGKTKLKDLLSNISCKSIDVSEPGMGDFFCCSRGKSFLDGVERKNKCIIEVVQDEVKKGDVGSGALPNGGRSRVIYQVSKYGKTFKVIQGDLTKHEVDVVVNAANRELVFAGGLALAIVKQGGKSIQNECSKVIERQGIVLPGKTAVSGAGNLPCKRVVHVVGPQWKGGNSNETDCLSEGIINALQETEKEVHKSLAIPAVGAGVLGIPLQVATQTIVASVVDYCTENEESVIREVHFMDTDAQTVQLFERALKSEIEQAVSASTVRATVQQQDSRQLPSPPPFQQTKPNELSTISGVVIKMETGQIALQVADVLVNTVGTRMDMSQGAVSSAILRQAGEELQRECCNRYPNGIAYGEVLDTQGHNLQCTKVYYIVAKPFGESDTEASFRSMIRNCLKKADGESFTSIAFPAIGTGQLGYKRDFVARVMLEEFLKFSEQYPRHLKDIRVVLYDKDAQTCQSFEAEFKLRGNTAGSSVSMRHGQTEHMPKVEGTSQLPSPLPIQQTKPNELSTQSGVVIKLERGQIALQVADVLVNTVGKHMDMSKGAVSSAISRQAGEGLQRECCNRYPNGITYGEVLDTQGHNLQCTKVYHIVAKPFGESDSEASYRSMIRDCLKKADGERSTSIAFPAIGTGVLAYKRNFVARVMLEEFLKFSEQYPRHLKDVRVVAYDKDTQTCQAFEAEFKLRVSTAGINVSMHHGQSGLIPKVEASTPNVIGNLTVCVLQGDITKQATDAILTPFSIGQVSAAIAKAGGTTILDECKNKGMPSSGCVITSAGNLPCRFVVHVDVLKNSISDVVQRALVEANNAGITSLSIPAIGTAASPDKARESAKHLFDAILKVSKSLDRLRSINIVIFQQPMVSTYESVRRKVFGQPEKKPFMQRIWSAVKSAAGKNDEEIGDDNDCESDVEMEYSSSEVAKVNLRLYGNKQSSIKMAISEIRQCCNEEVRDEELDANKNKEYGAIRLLNKREVETIIALETKHCVKVEIRKNKQTQRVRIRGRTEYVFKAKDEIRQLLNEAEQRNMLTEQARLLAKHVQWTFEEDDEWKPYSKGANLEIERSFSSNQASVRFLENEYQCEINFGQMKEHTPGQTPVSVKRVELGTSNIDNPSTWDNMTDNLLVVDLQPNSTEFAKVKADFTTTPASSVRKIQRIQNARLWKSFAIHKEYMESVNSKRRQIEKTLYHGTSEDTVDKINSQGFNRSFAGKNATALGAGVYFAVNASYSARNTYATPNPTTGEKHIYQCKVLTGEYTQGNSSMKAPPARNANGSVLYDTTCDNVNNPSIFVTFHDNQAYPEYLITFT